MAARACFSTGTSKRPGVDALPHDSGAFPRARRRTGGWPPYRMMATPFPRARRRAGVCPPYQTMAYFSTGATEARDIISTCTTEDRGLAALPDACDAVSPDTTAARGWPPYQPLALSPAGHLGRADARPFRTMATSFHGRDGGQGLAALPNGNKYHHALSYCNLCQNCLPCELIIDNG